MRWKIGKNELFFNIFDLEWSVSWLISLKMIRHVDYYVLIIWRGRKNCNYPIWNFFQVIRRQKFTFLVVFDHFLPLTANCSLNIVKNGTKNRAVCVSYAILMWILLKRTLKKYLHNQMVNLAIFVFFFVYLTIFTIRIDYWKAAIKNVENDPNKEEQNYFQIHIQKIRKHLRRSFYERVNS